MLRPTWAEVDLGAIRANVALLARLVAPARVTAVVKADGYGHGASSVARAALDGGAHGLAVALVEEGLALRDAGIVAPVLVLSDSPPDALDAALDARLDLTVASSGALEAVVAAAGGTHGVHAPPRLHLKVDTGMHRIGCEPGELVPIARRAVAASLGVHAVWSHLACADDLASPATDQQLGRFTDALDELRAAGVAWTTTHLANSAAAIAHPRTRFDEVRCGIAIYGVPPAPGVGDDAGLHPVLSLHSRVSALRTVPAGDGVSYGARWVAPRPTTIATVPIGYADGVPRLLGVGGGAVLVRGRPRPVRGAVTMDQLMIEVDDDVAIGDEVVLLGRQGDASVTAWDWAAAVGAIAYDMLTGIGARVPRRYP